MWIPVFNKIVLKTGKRLISKKRQTVAESQVSLQSLVKRRLASPELIQKNSSVTSTRPSGTSAFQIPLVQDQNVLVLDGWTGGGFLPCKL